MQIEISDKSLGLALIQASGQLGISHQDLAYEVISEEKRLWGLLGKKVTIKAWQKSRRPHSETKNRNSPSSRREEKPLVMDKDVLSKIQDFCGKLCSLIADREVEIITKQKGNYFVLSCSDEYLAEKLKKVPKLSESIERIILRVFKDDIRDKSFRLFFDANDVRQGKEEELISLAKSLAKKAARTKRTITLNYKHAHDRKIVHMTLENDSKIFTKSVGSGVNRKLLIIPTRGNERRHKSHS